MKGGRRRSELAALRIVDLDWSAFTAEGTIVVQLREPKTHKETAPPPLLLTVCAAKMRD